MWKLACTYVTDSSRVILLSPSYKWSNHCLTVLFTSSLPLKLYCVWKGGSSSGDSCVHVHQRIGGSKHGYGAFLTHIHPRDHTRYNYSKGLGSDWVNLFMKRSGTTLIALLSSIRPQPLCWLSNINTEGDRGCWHRESRGWDNHGKKKTHIYMYMWNSSAQVINTPGNAWST